MSAPYFLVDVDAKLSFSHDWSPFLAVDEDGNPIETVDSQEWVITPIHSGSPSGPIVSNASSDVVFVEGMLDGFVYRLKERITTSNGVRDGKTIVLRCSSDTC